MSKYNCDTPSSSVDFIDAHTIIISNGKDAAVLSIIDSLKQAKGTFKPERSLPFSTNIAWSKQDTVSDSDLKKCFEKIVGISNTEALKLIDEPAPYKELLILDSIYTAAGVSYGYYFFVEDYSGFPKGFGLMFDKGNVISTRTYH